MGKIKICFPLVDSNPSHCQFYTWLLQLSLEELVGELCHMQCMLQGSAMLEVPGCEIEKGKVAIRTYSKSLKWKLTTQAQYTTMIQHYHSQDQESCLLNRDTSKERFSIKFMERDLLERFNTSSEWKEMFLRIAFLSKCSVSVCYSCWTLVAG